MIEKIEEYARVNRVPIMMADGIDYLCNYIKENNIKNILEIGSAIGYSAIRMCLCNSCVYVTTIEKDVNRYNVALDNIKEFNLESRIDIYNMDALEFKTDKKFDLIFIDASKGNNINFFNMFKDNLCDDGVIITDNLSFHGLVEDEELVKTKNQRGIVRKIKSFIEFLNENDEFETVYVSVGDRISISRRKR